MRHQKHKGSLNISVPHRKAMLANMVTSLVVHNRIQTTHARAKEASKLADKMITLAKRGTLHARRQIIATIRSREAAQKLIAELAPLFKDRKGGYTRVLKYKRRVNDDAQLSILEFTEFPEIKEPKKKVKKAAKTSEQSAADADAQEKKVDEKKKKTSFLSGLKKKSKKQ